MEEMSGAPLSLGGRLGPPGVGAADKATCENERVKPLIIISRDGRSRKLKLTDLSFIFPYETVHQLRVRWIRADMEVISQSREPHTTDSSSL